MTAILALGTAAFAVLIAWTATYARRSQARDRALNRAAIDAHHAASPAEREAAFQLAPEILPHRYAACPVCQRGDYCDEGLTAWLAVPDEYAQSRTALAHDIAGLRTIAARAELPAQLSADAMARALTALCPSIWGRFDADHRPTGHLDAGFCGELDLQAYVNIEATIHAPEPLPMSALSDSAVGVDWDAELHQLLLTEATA